MSGYHRLPNLLIPKISRDGRIEGGDGGNKVGLKGEGEKGRRGGRKVWGEVLE